MRPRPFAFLPLCLLLAGAGTAAPVADPSLAGRAEAELRDNILPFWLRHARDPQTGRFVGAMTNDLVVDPGANRGALLNARILWTFSAAHRRNPSPDCLEMAKAARAELDGRFWDSRDGGYFWAVSAGGRVADAGKQIYGQSFALYGLAEFFRATGDRTALDRAIEVYRLIERHSRDREQGGYLEAFTRDWRRPGWRRLSAIGLDFPKSQNTHLHLMEAYTNLLRVWPDPGLRADLRALIEVMLTRVLDPSGRHLRLYFDRDWTPRSDIVSFGHDIEFSWLATETADVLGEPDLQARVRTAAVRIARGTLTEGTDTDGGVFNEAGPRGLTDPGKGWWPQAEAAVGFVNAYQISGDAAFLAAADRTWGFIERHLVDREHGEWFSGVSRDGRVRERRSKIGFWKCPYHNGRACMELAERLRPPSAGPAGPTAEAPPRAVAPLPPGTDRPEGDRDARGRE